MVTYDLEVDVVRDRGSHPWRARTHYVTAVVEESTPSRMDNEARNVAAWMCWHVRGEMVTAVRITAAEL